ncbi:MAG: COX15/CtaA family protein [Phycisphaerales bacterium]|nr:COX15/CtaA family protein [Phycisphaerales bacterium]
MSTQILPDTGNAPSSIGAAITTGFFAAVLMWMIAWVLHLPGVHAPLFLAIGLMLAALLGVCLLWIPDVTPSKRLAAGVLAGGTAGLINLMILGSFIVEQPESTADMANAANQFQPNAVIVVAGSLGVCVALGLLAGFLTRMIAKPAISPGAWLSRMGWVTACTYLPLIAVGGLVTSTDSGMAVPDAGTSYGALSVLFPIKLMAEPRIFFEHSHRLFGTLAGITTLVLMLRVLVSKNTKLPKILSVLLFLAVCLQGLLGYIRVADQSTFFAIFHGIFAQLVLATACCTAIALSARWKCASLDDEHRAVARRTRMMMALAFVALFMQLGLGAVTRHLKSSHAMMTHAAFAFVLISLLIIAGSFCIRLGKADEGTKGIRPFGAFIHGLVVLQFTLGWAVLGLTWKGEPRNLPTSEQLDSAPPPDIMALVPTAHQLIGALLFASVACGLFWAIRISSARKIG